MEHIKLCKYNWWKWQQKRKLFCYWVSCGNYSCWLLVLSTSHSEVDIAIPAIYCMKTVANLLRGPPGIGDWSYAFISKSLLNAAGPAPPHLSSKIMVCLACCPTPEIKSQLDRTALSLTVTMTETWNSHYWSADRPYLRLFEITFCFTTFVSDTFTPCWMCNLCFHIWYSLESLFGHVCQVGCLSNQCASVYLKSMCISLRASFTKQGRLAWERNSKSAPMSV